MNGHANLSTELYTEWCSCVNFRFDLKQSIQSYSVENFGLEPTWIGFPQYYSLKIVDEKKYAEFLLRYS